MKPSHLLCLALLLFCARAEASIWIDPDFATMVKSSDLIAMVEVVEGGAFRCKAKITLLLKGKAGQSLLSIHGYNNRRWPSYAVRKESFQKGDRVLLFLRKNIATTKKKDGTTQTSVRYFVPTPSTGDYRIKQGLLYGHWYRTSYPHGNPGTDAKAVLVLLHGYVLHLAGKTPTKARQYLANHLTHKRLSVLVKQKLLSKAEGHGLSWLLWAQGLYGQKAQVPAVLLAAHSKFGPLQLGAAIALRSAQGEPKALAALGKLLLATNTFVQAEAARSLLSQPFAAKDVLPLLLKALPTSSPKGRRSTNIMNPLQNVYASGREMIIRALTHYKAHKEAHTMLVGLLQDKGLSGGVFDALRDHFLRFRSSRARGRFLAMYRRCPEGALRYFHSYLLKEKSKVALQAVAQKILDGTMRSYKRAESLKQFAQAVKPTHPRLVALVRALLKKYPSSKEILRESIACLTRQQSKSSLKRAAQLIIKAPITPYDRGGLIAQFAIEAKSYPKIQGALIIAAIRQHIYTESGPKTLASCILAASKSIQEALKQINPAKFKEEHLRRLYQIIQEAVQLKLEWRRAKRQATKKELDAWLGLMEKEASIGYATAFLIKEIVAVTPASMRLYVAKEIRRRCKAFLSIEGLQAIQQLGGTLSAQERKRLPRHR